MVNSNNLLSWQSLHFELLQSLDEEEVVGFWLIGGKGLYFCHNICASFCNCFIVLTTLTLNLNAASK
jgi:hypothetical protein